MHKSYLPQQVVDLYDEWSVLCDVAADIGDETPTDPIT